MNILFKLDKSLLLSLLLMIVVSCKKNQDDFLNKKANNSDVTPSSLRDYQAMLDYDDIMNSDYSVSGLAGADDHYVPSANFGLLQQFEQNLYTWQKDIWAGSTAYDWSYMYQKVEYGNIVLDGIKNITPSASEQSSYNSIKGSALFFRAISFYNLLNLFSKPYMKSTAATDPGIVIRLTSDVNEKSTRATVQQSYDQIINDLNLAIPLLHQTQINSLRPTAVAANALLAKVYLVMEDYNNALKYANIVLTSKGDLIDFNSAAVSLTPSNLTPFGKDPSVNPEIIFFARTSNYTAASNLSGQSSIDTFLYRSYAAGDLRKTVYFYDNGNGTYRYKGTYDGFKRYLFAGIATNELYLIRSECYARNGDATNSLVDLNKLLSKRYSTASFVPLSTNNADTALSWVLRERRKEMPMTSNIRWEDLRRLNKDSRFAITLTRILNGNTYTLPPNDPKYVLPLPDAELQISGLEQNPR